MTQVYDDALQALELPTLVKVSDNLYLAAFQLMKVLPARYILESALSEGRITRNSRIVETSSGTFAMGLALVCSKHAMSLTIVGDPAIDDALRRRLEVLGADVIIVDQPKAQGGIQQARLDVVNEILASHADSFWPAQYDNPRNPQAYEKLVAHFVQAGLPKVDTLVGPVGSGGSMCGLTRALRRECPAMKSVAVDTHGSVLFGHPDRPRRLRGLGNSIMPRNLDHSLFDEVHWVSARDAFCAANDLYRQTRLFMGGTSGASFLVAKWRARVPGERVLCILPDEGTRYLAEFRHWSRDSAGLPDAPRKAAFADASDGHWTCFDWGRAALDQMKSHA